MSFEAKCRGEPDHRSAFAPSGSRIAALTRQMSRCAAPKTYLPAGATNSQRQDSAQLEVTGKTLICNDLLDWLGGRDSNPDDVAQSHKN